jgi:hypothetical protein
MVLAMHYGGVHDIDADALLISAQTLLLHLSPYIAGVLLSTGRRRYAVVRDFTASKQESNCECSEAHVSGRWVQRQPNHQPEESDAASSRRRSGCTLRSVQPQ